MRRSTRIKVKVETKVKSPKIKTPKNKPTKPKDEVANLNNSNLLNQIKKAGRNPDIEISPENKERRNEPTLADLKKMKVLESGKKERVKQTRKPKKDAMVNDEESNDIENNSDAIQEKQDVTISYNPSQECDDKYIMEADNNEKQEELDETLTTKATKASAKKERRKSRKKVLVKSLIPEVKEDNCKIVIAAADGIANVADEIFEEKEQSEPELDLGAKAMSDEVEEKADNDIDKKENMEEEEEMEALICDDETDIVVKVSNDDIDERSTVDFNIDTEKVAPVTEVLSDEDSSSCSSSIEEKTTDNVSNVPTNITNDNICKDTKVFKFDLDRSKYMLCEDKSSVNPLMQTLSSLKKSFPFKDHILNNKKSANYDVLCLDSLPLTNKTPIFNKADISKLSSQVQAPKQPELYFDSTGSIKSKSKLDSTVNELMKKSSLNDDLERMEKAPKLHVSKHLVKADAKKKSEETAGKGWYNLPKTEITESIKKDLQIIKMRGALDPKKHYRRNDTNKLPKYFQMGTVVEGAHEFYSSRVPQGKRKKNMVDELLEDAEFRRKNKKQFLELRKKQMSGGKRFYKEMMNKKKETWERT